MGSPEHPEEELFNAAIALRDSGDLEGACEKFSLLIKEYPNFAAAYVLKGGVLRSLQNLEEAIWCFRRAVELKPKAEIASRSLFHSLWGKGNQIAAMEEIKRFVLAGGTSQAYKKIIFEALENALAGHHEGQLRTKIMEVYHILKARSGDITEYPRQEKSEKQKPHSGDESTNEEE